MTKHEAVKAYFEPKVEELAGTLISWKPPRKNAMS